MPRKYKYQEIAFQFPKGVGCYNKEKNLFFFMIPKNASTSIRSTLEAQSGFERSNFYETKTRPTSFCVIRNPYSRALSGYVEALKRGEYGFANKGFFDIKDNRERFLSYLEEAKLTFRKDPFGWDPHVRQQHFFISDDDDKLLPEVKYFLTFSNELSNYYNVLANKLDIYPTIRKTNFKPKHDKDYLKQVLANEPKYINILEEIYADDIELFNSKKTEGIYKP